MKNEIVELPKLMVDSSGYDGKAEIVMDYVLIVMDYIYYYTKKILYFI